MQRLGVLTQHGGEFTRLKSIFYRMEALNWTADMESCLFYAMMDHKPVGKNYI